MKLILPVVLAAFLAFVLGWMASKSFHVRAVMTTERATGPALASEHTTKDAVSEIAAPVTPSEQRSPAAAVAETRSSEGLISEMLHKYALAEIDAGWHETRAEPLPEPLLAVGFREFEDRLRKLPREIGRRLAKKQTHLDTLASDDPFAVLAALHDGNLGPQVALVQNDKVFTGYFACESGPRVDGLALLKQPRNEATPLEPGTLIDFPAGVHHIQSLADRLRSSVRCVTIAGAGMDQTLLRLGSIDPTEKLDRLELRDCTIESSCEAIELRTVGVWRAQRVRFIGFDCGAGGSSALNVQRGTVLELKSCRIEGGFGRSPGGNLFDVRTNAFLARFEDCTISSLRADFTRLHPGSTLILRRCRLENLLDSHVPVDLDNDGVVLESTTIELRLKDAGPIPKRDVAELFPAWIQPTKR